MKTIMALAACGVSLLSAANAASFQITIKPTEVCDSTGTTCTDASLTESLIDNIFAPAGIDVVLAPTERILDDALFAPQGTIGMFFNATLQPRGADVPMIFGRFGFAGTTGSTSGWIGPGGSVFLFSGDFATNSPGLAENTRAQLVARAVGRALGLRDCEDSFSTDQCVDNLMTSFQPSGFTSNFGTVLNDGQIALARTSPLLTPIDPGAPEIPLPPALTLFAPLAVLLMRKRKVA